MTLPTTRYQPADTVPFATPEVEVCPGFIRYEWGAWGIGIIADRYDSEGAADLQFYYTQNSKIIIPPTHTNLTSLVTRTALIKTLKYNLDTFPWHDVMTYVTNKTLQIAREGQPLQNLGTKPATMKLSFRLWPILEEGEPTTIYCPPAHGKSYLAAYIACLVQFDKFGLADTPQAWTPTQGNVLYLDYESSYEKHQRRVWAVKQGLGIDDDATFLYRRCEQPFVRELTQIQRLVADNDIKLMIVDSQIAASSYGPDPAQVASQYYNSLRSLQCANLTLDHVSKSEMQNPMDAEGTGPYGSVVKSQRARQTFQLRRHQVPGQDYLDLDLIHSKNNEGRLLDQIGIRINFIYDSYGVLGKVTFTPLDIATHPVFGAARKLEERLVTALEGGPMTTRDLAELLPDKTEATIRATLNRYKDRFVKLLDTDEWGLRAYDH